MIRPAGNRSIFTLCVVDTLDEVLLQRYARMTDGKVHPQAVRVLDDHNSAQLATLVHQQHLLGPAGVQGVVLPPSLAVNHPDVAIELRDTTNLLPVGALDALPPAETETPVLVHAADARAIFQGVLPNRGLLSGDGN